MPEQPSSLVSSLSRYVPQSWYLKAPVVPVVRLSGQIGISSPLRPGLTLQGVSAPLERAFSIRGAKAVALAINSPGGSAVQSRLIYGRIRALAQEKKLPVYVFIEDLAASGGYMLALAGDEIHADNASIVGSIGVVAATFGFNKAMDKIGVDRRVYTAGRSKMILDPFQPEKAEEVERIKAIQGEIHDIFKAMVRERRAGKLKGDEDELFSGAFWSGQRALESGLIDGLGEMRGVLREKFGEKVRLKLVSSPRKWLRGRIGGLAAMPRSVIDAGDGLAVLEERSLWARFGL